MSWKKPQLKRNKVQIGLLALKRKTAWSWERMCREMHRVMEKEGPSHTTLFRYAQGRIGRPNKLTQKYIVDALQLLKIEAR